MVAVNEPTVKSDGFETAFAGAIDFLPLGGYGLVTTLAERDQHQAQLRTNLADGLYGQVPSPPDDISVSRQPIAGDRVERVVIKMTVAGRRFAVDAALWLPPNVKGPAPLICGLDFVGPVGLINSPKFPIDENARISSRDVYGARENKRIEETLRGVSAYRWPVDMMLDAGYAVLVSCYGSWVPDDADDWKNHGLYPLLNCATGPPVGAISLWAWAIQRLVDTAETFDGIDATRVSAAGHSRLGKSVLWAAANDPRIGAVLATNSGCGGSAPAAHPVGETLAEMAEAFPHWTIPSGDSSAKRDFDQHHLLSLIAPRAIYLAHAKADVKADPIGSLLALEEASEFWKLERPEGWTWPAPREVWQTCGQVLSGSLGYHLRPGGHDILPYDWRKFLDFLETV
jgi:hypothetical protein